MGKVIHISKLTHNGEAPGIIYNLRNCWMDFDAITYRSSTLNVVQRVSFRFISLVGHDAIFHETVLTLNVSEKRLIVTNIFT